MKILYDTSLVYKRGYLEEEFFVTSRARATMTSTPASLKKTRRSAEVGAFDVGRPPPLLWEFPTGSQNFHCVSIYLVRNQAVGGPGPGETGPGASQLYIKDEDRVERPCSPQAFGRRVFCCPSFRGAAGARSVAVEFSASVLAAHRSRVLLSALGESEICFGFWRSGTCCDISSLSCLCT